MVPPAPLSNNGRLVAVIVTHNRLALLQDGLRALLAAPPAHLAAVLVVDNAATDGTGAWLAAQTDLRLHVLTLPDNRGGAGGFEAGMRHAMAHLAPDWLLLTDDDARPEPGALAVFHATNLAGWDAVAAAVRLPNGRPCRLNRPTYDPFRRSDVLLRTILGGGRAAFHVTNADFDRPGLHPVDGASFVGLFLARRVVDRAGYPDGRLFLYADDAIYTLGLSRAGFRIAFAPAIAFRHDHTTFAADTGRIQPLWKAYYNYRNLILLYRQIAGGWFWPALLAHLPAWALSARRYPGQAGVFLRLLALATGDALSARLDRPHTEVVARATDPATRG